MSKNIKTTALVLVLLLAFLCGFGLGKNKGFNLNINNNPYGTTAPAEDDDVTQVDATTEPADDQTAESKPAKPLKAPKGVDAVVSAYNKAVNRAKRAETLTIHKTVTLEMQPGEITPGLAKGAAQSAIKRAVQPIDQTFKVRSDGKDTDKTAKEILSPAGKASKISADDVTAAKAKAKDGGYVIVIKLKDEAAAFKNDKVKQAKAHAAGLTMPDPSAMTAFGMKLMAAKIKYSGTTLRATIDSSGNLVKVEYKIPFSATLTGKFYVSKMSAAIDGTITETAELSA